MFLAFLAPYQISVENVSHCFAKAVHSRAKLRIADCLSIRPSVCCPTPHLKTCVLPTADHNISYKLKILCETQLSAEDRSFKVKLSWL